MQTNAAARDLTMNCAGELNDLNPRFPLLPMIRLPRNFSCEYLHPRPTTYVAESAGQFLSEELCIADEPPPSRPTFT